MSKNLKPIYIISAIDNNNGIGKNKVLPWHISGDLKFFQKTTEHTENSDRVNVVIMGRTTWESIPEKYRPLKGRRNYVLTRQEDYKAEGAFIFNSFDEAIKKADNDEFIESIFVIGGASIYKEVISNKRISGIYLTEIDSNYDCDTFFPHIPNDFAQITHLGKGEDKGIEFDFLLYEKQNN